MFSMENVQELRQKIRNFTINEFDSLGIEHFEAVNFLSFKIFPIEILVKSN